MLAPATAPEAPLADVHLVRAALGGSAPAFRTLVERYQDRIYRLAFRLTRDAQQAEDVAQETFLKAFRRLQSFRFSSSFFTWLYRIALNNASDALSRRRREPALVLDDPDRTHVPRAPEEASDPGREAMRAELGEVTRRVLVALPAKYREILVLREYEDLTYEEMAEVLGCALGTVESRLFRARARFRAKLEEMFPDYLPTEGGGGRIERWRR